ncbi:MAG: hypothetical protein ACYCSR_10255 [Thiomonas sp.]
MPTSKSKKLLRFKLGAFGALFLGLAAWGSAYYFTMRLPASAARTAQARKDPCVDQILTARDGRAIRVPKRDIVHAEQFCRQQSNILSASHSEWTAP